MNLLNNGFVGSRGDDTRRGSGISVRSIKGWGEECRAEGGFATPRTRVSSGHGMRWMVGLKGPSQELLRQHPQVVLNGEHLRLLVEVSDRRPPGAARGNA